MMRLLSAAIGLAALLAFAQAPATPQFELVQPELFAASGGQPNAWADVDNDGDLDLFVGFNQGKPNRLYRNDRGTFVDIASAAGMADLTDTRAASWGDFDGDGHVDLYVGFTRRSEMRNKLYRNDGSGTHFTDVGKAMGVDAMGETRQVSWIDADNDGDLDLFVAFRDAPNMLFRNDGNRFTSVAKELGLDDPRRTVGAVWFDFDEDGDLDVFVANQNGDSNGLFRNDGRRFADVAKALGMDAAGRPETEGSNGPSVADIDGDGDLDLDARGRATRAGSEVRVFTSGAGTRRLLGTGIVDSGSGYCSQNVMPVHIGLGWDFPPAGKVDVEVTTLTKRGRAVTRVAGAAPGLRQIRASR